MTLFTDPNEYNDYDPPAYLRRRVAERVRRNVPLLPEWAVVDCAKWEVKDEWVEKGRKMVEVNGDERQTTFSS
jgi:hypothetical protein